MADKALSTLSTISKYKIYAEQNLLVDFMENNVSLSDLKELFVHTIADPDFRYVHKVLSNITKAKLNITVNELTEFINFIESPNPDASFKWAILTEKPNQTAFSLLIKEEPYFRNVVGVFSTLVACNKFLNINFDEKEFYEPGFHYLF